MLHNSVMPVKSFEPDVFNAECPAQQALDLVASKWTMLVLLALLSGEKRNGVLKRKIGGITQKMLTQTLRRMEREGLVLRHVHSDRPPVVGYSLTELGESLIGPIRALTCWAQDHSAEVEAAKGRHGDTQDE